VFDLLATLPSDMLPLLLLGLGLGLLHSLDADHVMAVSVLNNQNPSFSRTISFALYWALGHGGVLLCGGLLLFGLGISIPERFSFMAEVGVALLLIGLGAYLIWQLRSRRVRIKQHRHGDIVHTHLHIDGHTDEHVGSTQAPASVAGHRPVMVGVLHGFAGSAPALALIPAVASGKLMVAMTYLALFSLGVIISMVAFGIGFTTIQTFLYRRYQSVFQWMRGLLAVGAIIAGSALLLRTL
jgi:ABC-type nickel/cobalt efflux system permease component RcnA